jgi:hypothetical protein
LKAWGKPATRATESGERNHLRKTHLEAKISGPVVLNPKLDAYFFPSDDPIQCDRMFDTRIFRALRLPPVD